MPRRLARPPMSVRTAGRGLLVASLLAVLAVGAVAAALAPGAAGGSVRSAKEQARVEQRVAARRALARATREVPAARGGRCGRTAPVPGQGRSCRTSDGLFLVPQAQGAPLVTHGPDVLAAPTGTSRAGGFGTTASIACAPQSRTRHVSLLYMVPSDHAGGGASVRGDRYAEVAPQLRQALLDAAAMVDARAGELVPGARRRIRVRCTAQGEPEVLRVVLPRTAAQYRSAGSGFGAIGDDLQRLGIMPDYAGFHARRLPAVTRLLGYYDAEFHPGLAGQGTMFRRSELLRRGVRASDPLVSRTTRNINNNPPGASLAIQYGTRDGAGQVVPPAHTDLLHELTHTMGAVQDEPPTSSDAGHCDDGLDIMCYPDGASSRYSDRACPAAAGQDPRDAERFDCNGDTYFHPSPGADNPLSRSTVWHLGLPANETLARSGAAPPAAPASASSRGAGTSHVVRWEPVAGADGYEVSLRRGGGEWRHASTVGTSFTPLLSPTSRYEVAIAAVAPGLVAGSAASVTIRTGVDTTAPTPPGRLRATATSRTSVRVRAAASTDNVRVTRYRVERRSGGRWITHLTATARPGPPVLEVRGLAAGTRHVLRLRALDGRGNVSRASRPAVASTPR